MSSGPYRDKAVVVRTYDFAEADRIVVLLTRTHGVVRCVAKGVRRAKSRFGSRLQPFVVIDALVYPGRNLATIAGADTVDFYAGALIEDFERYAAASAVVETAERFGQTQQEDPALFDSVERALKEIGTQQFPVLALDQFLLQAMTLEGWAPSLFDCAVCQAPGPHHAFHPAVGGAVCFACRPTGSSQVPPESLHVMWLLAGGYFAKAQEICEGDNGRVIANAAHRLTVAHLQWHLETSIKSLQILDQG